MAKDFEDKVQEDIEKFFTELGKDPKQVVAFILVVAVGAAVLFSEKLLEKFGPYIPEGVDVSTAGAVGIGKTILTWVLVMAAVFIIGNLAIKLYHYNYNKRNFVYLRVLPNTADKVDATTLGEMIRRIHNAQRGSIRRTMWGRDWFSFIIHHRKIGRSSEYVFYIGGPKDRIRSVKNHISSLYASAEFFPADDIPMPSKTAVGGRLDMKRRRKASTLSLARYKKDQLPGILDVMEPGTWVQVAFSGDSEHRLKKLIIEAEKEVKADKGWRDRNAFEVEEEKSFKKRFYGNETSFEVTVSIAAENWNSARDTADGVIGIMNDVNELKYRRRFGMVMRYPIAWPHKMIWTGSELATLFHLPELSGSAIAEKMAKRIPHGDPGTQKMDKHSLASKDGFTIGTLVHPVNHGREVRIKRDVLTKHFALTGITGSGKSTVLNQLLKSFIEANLAAPKAPGFTFIDPKKETATIVLNQILKMEKDGAKVDWSKVKWISFKDAKNPPAMNLLYRMPGVPKTVLVDQVMRIIKESNPNRAHQAERLLKKCIETLVADEEVQHTILGVQPLLMKAKFRKAVLDRLAEDPKNISLLDFWEDEAEDLMNQSAQAIQNRLDIFHSEFMAPIFGQPDFNFPFRKWMDEGYMVLFDFNGMGEEETAIIGGYLSYLYYRTADRRPDGSLFHALIIDEAQRVKASILPEIIAEMRSKGLGLGISTQTLDGLEPMLRNKLVNVAASVFVCGQGPEGAKSASEAFRKPGADGKDKAMYSDSYFQNLPKLRTVIRTEDDDGTKAFAVVDVPPLDRYLPDGSIAKYGDEKQIEQSNNWTEAKALELEEANGRPMDEVIKGIRDYLTQGSPKPVNIPKKKVVVMPEAAEDKVVQPSIMQLAKGAKKNEQSEGTEDV